MNMQYIRQITNFLQNFMPIHLLVFMIPIFFHPEIAKGQKTAAVGIKTIIIDPGHGGKDPGAIAGRAKEKDIVLDIALRLGKLINRGLPDVKVIYTRKGDYFVPLFERAVIANNSNANLFISIHANFCRTPSVKGTETYVLGLHRIQDNLDVAKKENSVILLEDDYTRRYEGFDPNSPDSYIMFELIQDNYIEQSVMFAGMLQDIFRQLAHRADRDVRQAGFLVLRETTMPSVLIETGYLSNKSEAAYLMTANGRETIASSIFRSIKNYKSRIESRSNLNLVENKNIERELIGNKDNKKTIPVNVPKKKDIKPDEREAPPVQYNKESTRPNSRSQSEKTDVNDYTYAIQITASKVKLPLNSKIFKGIGNIQEIRVGDYFKYFCMESGSRDIIKQNLITIKKRIPDAFLVGLKNGQVIPFKDAINHK